MASQNHQPLRLDWTLSHPVRVPPRPLHLDALLAWSRVEAAWEAGDDDPIAAQTDLPLTRSDEGDDWVWKASRVILTPEAPPFLVQTVRRVDYHDMALDKGRVYAGGGNTVTPGTGRYKAFDMRESHQWCRHATAWCIGDQAAVKTLLARVRYIGGHRRNGWGRVESLSVTVDEAAHRHWMYRTLPTPREGYAAVEATIRPPYWSRADYQIAYEPLHDLETLYV